MAKTKNNQNQKFQELVSEVEEDIGELKLGEEIEGEVVGKDKYHIFVDLSPWGTGVIYKQELRKGIRDSKNINPGDEIKAKVVSKENEESFIELSVREINTREAWNKLKSYYNDDEVVTAKIISANKGGLMAEAEGLVGFLPASQLGQKHYPRVEDGDSNKILEKLKKLEGEKLEVKILDLDPDENKLIFSEKEANAKEIEDVIAEYEVGDTVEGEVTGVVDFGAFVQFDENLEGLVHISELDWKLIENPRDIVEPGETVKAKIIEIEDHQVSLSIKALKEDPWENIEEKYEVGNIYEGKVTQINPFGAFVYLDEDIHGLAHISQFGSQERMNDRLDEDETYAFKIKSYKPKEHRMSLELVGESKEEAKEKDNEENQKDDEENENEDKKEDEEN